MERYRSSGFDRRYVTVQHHTSTSVIELHILDEPTSGLDALTANVCPVISFYALI